MKRIPVDHLIAALTLSSRKEGVSTGELGKVCGVHRNTARDTLQDLEVAGMVECRGTGWKRYHRKGERI
jgi:predicted ArsR family transcriptional regulator